MICRTMKVAISNVASYNSRQATCTKIFPGELDHVWESRDRDCYIGNPHLIVFSFLNCLTAPKHRLTGTPSEGVERICQLASNVT